jgi:putative membrane protein
VEKGKRNMIDRFDAHAANERTMLAWVRTALAVVAFGFLVEKLNLFLRLSGLQKTESSGASYFAEWLGVVIIAEGVIILLVALFRYFVIFKAINSDTHVQDEAPVIDIGLIGMLVILILTVAVFLAHSIGWIS